MPRIKRIVNEVTFAVYNVNHQHLVCQLGLIFLCRPNGQLLQHLSAKQRVVVNQLIGAVDSSSEWLC